MPTELLFAFSIVACCVVGSPRAQQHVPAPDEPGAQHMHHRFDDAERYAKQFDDPARDAWQMPSRVIDALALAPGQISRG